MKEVEKKIKVYITTDGKEFTNKKEAEKWEEECAEVSYFVVHYSPDLNEGRTSSQRKGLVQVVGFRDNERSIAQFACERAFGGSYAFVQGVFDTNAMMPNFSLGSSPTDEELENLDTVIIVQGRFAKKRVREKEGIYYRGYFPKNEEKKIY